jgi:hypothetical protein
MPYVRRYLIGEALSIVGDNSLWLAIAICVRAVTGSNVQAAFGLAFMALPVVADPFWGAVVDRYPDWPS